MSNLAPTPPDDADGFIDLERLLAAARRQMWVVALFAALGIVLGGVYLVFTPPTYTAATHILLDDSLTKFAADDQTPLFTAQADTMVLSEVEILKSARLARAVVEAENLQDNEAFLNPPRSPYAWFKSTVKSVLLVFAETPPPSNVSPEEAKIGRAIALLQRNLRAERVGRSFVIELSFSANDPRLAGAVTRAYAEAYLSDHLEANFDATQRATVWLQGRLDDLRERSQAAALEVEKYRAAHGLTAASGELMSDQQLSDLNSQLILAQADTANALARYNQFKSIVDSGPENAVRNATIPIEEGTSGSNISVLTKLRSRYMSMAQREQDISNRFGEDHPQAVALRREEADVTQQIFAELKRLTESYRNAYEVAKSREASLRASVGELADQNSKSGQSSVELRALEQKAQALATLYQTFLARYGEASQEQSFPIAQARVISQADNPSSPSSPRKSMVLGLAMVLGLFAGAGVGALREFRERFFRTAEDVQNALDIKFLGYLPIIGGRSSGTKAKPGLADAENPPQQPDQETNIPRILRVAINAPSSSFAETLRNVKLASDVVLQRSPCKVIGFVSVLPHEGKTTVAANFAGLLAANGFKTLLIDGDLRNPGLSRSLPLLPKKGLVEAIVGGDQRWQNTILLDRKTRLAILPSVVRGRISHTSELLSGPGMRELVEEARQSFNYIIVDLPPLGPVVDAKAFAPLADGFVMVAEWGATPRALVRSTLQGEPQIAAKTLGIVLNKTDIRKLPRYGLFGGAEQYLDRYTSYYVEQQAGPAGKTANKLESV